jgi:NAD(P)-dependent dehydrogenase (short-subunit alcohol dehydrogenase family)
MLSRMEFDLAGRTYLVTGSTQGVGAAIAMEAARRGAGAIAVVGRSAEKGKIVARQLTELGAESRFFEANLSQPDAPAALFDAVLEWRGAIDGLVNSAGITTRASVVDGTLEQWESIMALDLRAPFFLMQRFIRHRLERSEPGAVVNIGSMNGYCGIPELAIYATAKGALATLTRNAANAHVADRIRVNLINMGWAATDAENEMQSRTLGRGERWAEEAARSQPLGRLLEPAEVARLCVYLLSDYSGLQTGACIDLEQSVLGAWRAG